ncbi:hypothetical protein RS030_2275 [Cryptosporidium xiaoi]|uniref:FCH domain-containing protein n=1 Tax=Cryptosporidium xiaoi TaxID=659607 RepID=A0AAV9XVW4_9CRYT
MQESPEDKSNKVDTNIENREQHLTSYEIGFLHDWTLICTRIENGLKLVEQMKLAIEERASLEELYSSGLESISSKFFPPGTESTTLSSAIISLRNETYRRSKHCRELSETLRSDVLNNTLNNMLENHRSAYSHLFKTGKGITDELQKKYSDFIRLRDNYGIARHNVGQLSLRYHELAKENTIGNKTTLLGSEILRKILEVEQLEKDYNNSVENFEIYYGFYLNQMKHIMKTMEDMDKKRIKCLSDTFMKMMIYDMSYIRNLQYDSNNVISSLQDINAEKDISEYINRFGESNNETYIERESEKIINLRGISKIDKEVIKKENWRDICNKMSNLKISNDEFITLTTSQMAEKNIMLENMLDLQSIISTLVNPSTAIKAQKAVKVLLTQLNILVNESNQDDCENDNDVIQKAESFESIDSYTASKEHSFESSTTCSNEAIQDNIQESSNSTVHNCNSKNNANKDIEIRYKSIYDELIYQFSNINKNNNVLEKINSINNYGLNEYKNCDYYLSALMNHTIKSKESKLILNMDNEHTDKLKEHLFIILDHIQNENSVWLFRKMLFLSESVIINDSELFKYVYKHDIWNLVKIWEDTILLCISEDYQRKIIESDSLEFEKFRNIDDIEYFDKLSNIEKLPLLMRKFGIPEIPIITLFTKICSQNGLEKSYCDKLLFNIKNIK